MNIITNDMEKSGQAIDSLRSVMDPEIGLNVVDLGLIYQIDFDTTGKNIYCSMTLTTQFCPMGESISGGVTNALEQTFPDFEIEVKVIFDPPWNLQMITDKGREILNQ